MTKKETKSINRSIELILFLITWNLCLGLIFFTTIINTNIFYQVCFWFTFEFLGIIMFLRYNNKEQ